MLKCVCIGLGRRGEKIPLWIVTHSKCCEVGGVDLVSLLELLLLYLHLLRLLLLQLGLCLLQWWARSRRHRGEKTRSVGFWVLLLLLLLQLLLLFFSFLVCGFFFFFSQIYILKPNKNHVFILIMDFDVKFWVDLALHMFRFLSLILVGFVCFYLVLNLSFLGLERL